MCAQVRLQRRNEPRRQAVLGRAHGDPRSERRDRLVADVLVDELRCLPERVDVDTGVEAEAGEGPRDRLARHPMDRERDRVDSAGDQVGAAARGLEPRRERVPAGALTVQSDRQAALLAQRRGQLLRLLRLE